MKKGEIYEGRVQEVLFPDKAIVVTDEGETAQVKYGIPGQKLRFRVKKKRKEKIEGILLEVLEKSADETACLCEWAGNAVDVCIRRFHTKSSWQLKKHRLRKCLIMAAPIIHLKE